MKGWNRFAALLLALGLIFGMIAPAGAEVMTLGVYFRGILEKEDGSTVMVPLSGSFRVMQGGLDRGVIQAGESTVTLSGTDPVSVTPMMETIPAGWDLTQAAVTVEMAGGNVTVPVLVRTLTENSVAAVPGNAESAAVVSTAQGSASSGTENSAQVVTSSQSGASAGGEASGEAANASQNGASSGGNSTSASVVNTSQSSAGSAGSNSGSGAGSGSTVVTQSGSTNVHTLNQTPVPTSAPTPEPAVSTLTATADTGAFHLKAFFDSNSNGDCSIYEKGVAGVQIYIVSQSGEIVTGGKTGADGEITLAGLKPGAYRVRVFLEDKWGFNRQSKETGLNKSIMNFSSEGNQDSDPIRVSAGETVERGIGLLKGVVVEGTCWLDENGDGIMNSGEPRIAGAHITMNGQKNGLSFEAWSDANGHYRMYRLRAGFYDFTSYAPDGMMFTRYSKTGGKNRSIFTTEGKTKLTKTLDLNDGGDETDQNIGFTWQAAVSGIAFLDANYNGLYDEGEKPLAGVKVTAIKQVKDEEIAVTVTGSDGRYTLGGLRGNTYRIRAVLPDDGCNFTVTTANLEGNHFAARENRRENFWKDFVLQDGETRTVNVGAIYYGSVSGTVYMDDDFSGTRSGSEKTVQGISVTLLNANGAAVDSKQTSAKGSFTFTGLTPGRYSLRMTAQSGYAFTRPGADNIMLNLNGGEGYSETFEVPLGESVTGKNAGMIRPATVRGMVFADRNDNGKQDGSEAGLAGTTVRLMSEEGTAFSAKVGDSGEFLFDAVMPGRYYLEYELPEGAIFARTGGGNTITGENGTGRGEWFDMKSAGVKEAPLCGGLTLGRIAGTVFHDHDGSGTMDAEDLPLAGARVTLIPSREDLETAEAVTGEDGLFELNDLHPDSWQLQVTLPEGMVAARMTNVTLPLDTGTGSQVKPLNIAMGESWTDQLIGAVRPAVMRGRVWLDENNNGLLDEGEATPAGMAMTVTDEGSGQVFETLYSDENGRFEHTGVVPGTYTVSYRMEEDTDQPPEGDNSFRRENGSMVMTGIALEEGGAREDMVLGLVKYTAMGGMVWMDQGSSTVRLAGASVSLLDEDGNELKTQMTDDSGEWRFSGLMPGNYRIQAELPTGAVAAEPDDERLQKGMISILQDTDGRYGLSDLIALKMGEDQLSLNIGSVLPGTIGDFCWLDLNGNGWQDGGELGIPHVKVELVRNGVTASVTETDQYGLYFFREVYPAVYTLKVTAPAEVKPTQKRTDIYLIVSSLLETEDNVAWTEEFAVASDSTDFNIDLGYVMRTPGNYPPGYGEQETQDWSKAYENVTLK